MPSPRIAPLEPPVTLDVEAELARWMPQNSPVPPLALFRTLVRNLPLAQAMLPLGRFLLSSRLSLSRRLRELVIDRVTARCGCEYEWGVHVAVYGGVAGFHEAAVAATAHGTPTDPAWSPEERTVVAAIDALHDTGHVPDEIWNELAARFTSEQCLELLVLAGWYHLISYVANGAGVPLESWAARFPAPTG